MLPFGPDCWYTRKLLLILAANGDRRLAWVELRRE